MNGRTICLSGCVLSIFAALGTRDMSAQLPESSSAKANVGITIRVHPRNGKTVESRGGSVVHELLPGETGTSWAGIGLQHDPCRYWLGAGKTANLEDKIAEQRASLARFWSFETRLIETTVEATTVDLNWVETSRINPSQSTTESWRLTLRNGEKRPIALVAGPANSDCMSVALEVTADAWQDPALAGRVIDWDLWWKKDAQSEAIHNRMSSLHGEEVRFAFEPMAVEVRSADGRLTRAWLHAYGRVTGRLREDGNIDVAIYAQRLVHRSNADVPNRALPQLLSRSGGLMEPGFGSGRKLFSFRPDEAVAILMRPYRESNPSPVTTSIDPRTGHSVATVDPTRLPKSSNETLDSDMSLTLRARIR